MKTPVVFILSPMVKPEQQKTVSNPGEGVK